MDHDRKLRATAWVEREQAWFANCQEAGEMIRHVQDKRWIAGLYALYAWPDLELSLKIAARTAYERLAPPSKLPKDGAHAELLARVRSNWT